ncbi:MAG: FAD-binding oxidoreductase [Burkholderia sp.]
MQARVQSLESRGRSVAILRLLPIDEAFQYREGQYLSIAVPGTNQYRAYSMATPCEPDGAIELHIRLHEHGMFSRMLRGQIEVGSTVTLSGPYGDCVWGVPPDSGAKVILLATGTGIAPLKAMIERQASIASRHELWLYWGGDRPEDLYLAETLQALARAHPRFHFVPVLAAAEPDWRGARGFVQDVAAADHPDLREAHVFACGAPVMVRMARERLTTACGLPEDRFFFDSFEPSEPGVDAGQRASVEPVTLSVRVPGGERRAVHCRAGESLMRSLVAERLVQAICGGNQSCGTCRVTIDEADLARLPAMSRAEKRLLAALPASGARDRLSCQLEVDARYEGLQLCIPEQDF